MAELLPREDLVPELADAGAIPIAPRRVIARGGRGQVVAFVRRPPSIGHETG